MNRYKWIAERVEDERASIVGGGMEFFMINTGFYDKVTVLEAEKRAYENSPEAQAVREALNPWRNKDAEATKTPP